MSAYSPAELDECVIDVGHRTRAGRIATWRDKNVPVEQFRVCDRHKGYYETAYDDYSHIEWERIAEQP